MKVHTWSAMPPTSYKDVHLAVVVLGSCNKPTSGDVNKRLHQRHGNLDMFCWLLLLLYATYCALLTMK